MATDVSICSNALLMVGAQTINSMDTGDFSDRQRICVNLYPTVRDYVLSVHPWNCCRKRILLNPDADVPAFGWTTQYTLPADFGRMLGMGDDDEVPFDYTIEDGKLLTNESGVLKLRYAYMNRNAGRWPPLLVHAATMAMRAVLAYPITQSTSLEQLVDQTLAPILQKARAIDSQDRPPQGFGDFPLLASRYVDSGTF
jgi:hypothetical protein